MWSTCRTSLSTASRIIALIRTDAPPLHEAAALRPERFWSVEKTNAGKSKLRSLSQVLAAPRELIRAGAKRSGRLATPPPTPPSQSLNQDCPHFRACTRGPKEVHWRFYMGKVEAAASATFSDA